MKRRARHRRPSPVSSALHSRTARIALSVTAIVVAAGSVGLYVNHGAAPSAPAAAVSGAYGRTDRAADRAASTADSTNRAGLTGRRSASGQASARQAAALFAAAQAAAKRAAELRAAGRRAAAQRAARRAALATYYRNPVRAISGLIPERIDMGVDFGGTGPIYALGNAVITGATANNLGWPGGGWITYRLTDGPAAGLMVFLAEDVVPTVTAGQQVSSSTVIAHMFAGGAGIETGWAMPSGFSAESQLPEAGAIWGGGPFPTAIGMNFEELLQATGVPAGNNRTQSTFGIVPSRYPSVWTPASLRRK